MKQEAPPRSIHEGNQTYELILQAAFDLFSQQGYHSVTTRSIAARAGVNLGLIPYYFQSKDNLAAIVMEKLNNDLYAQIFDLLPPDLKTAEKMYISTLLLCEHLEANYARFMFEYAETKQAYYSVSRTFLEMSWDLIREYHLSVTPEENEFYLAAFKGAERLIILKRSNNDLDISYEEITTLIVSNYFYNIGLSDQTIADILTRSSALLHEYNHFKS